MKKIGIIDYGSGNIFSLLKAFQHLEFPTEVIDVPDKLPDCSHLVIPGVGAFRNAMDRLSERGFTGSIKQESQKGKPLLAICVGMQILFETSEEFGHHSGLGLIRGTVTKIPNTDRFGNVSLVPHVGWSETRCNINCLANSKFDLFLNMSTITKFYYLHSYSAKPVCERSVIASTIYGGNAITAAVQKENVFGTQFHPEKSGLAGLKVLENFGCF